VISFAKHISIIFRCGVQYRSDKLIDSDLNGVEATYVFHICKNPGISQEQLAKLIYINKSNVTRKLASLEEKGYVERNISESDKRVTKVYPTPKALEVLPRIQQSFHDWNEYITEDLTEEEKEQLAGMLLRITAKTKLYNNKNISGGEGITL
jgi:DNA-binding MarR family transcriptional regulator